MKRISIFALIILVVVLVIVIVRYNTGPRYDPTKPTPIGTPTPAANQ